MSNPISSNKVESVISELANMGISDDAINRVGRNLSGIIHPPKLNLRTPFLNDLNEEEILRKFKTDVLSDIGSLEERLIELEISNLNKFGPRSLAKPWVERSDSTYGYFDQYDLKEFIPSVIRPERGDLTPVSVDVVKKYILKSASSGLPYMERKGDVLEHAIQNLDTLLQGEQLAMLFTRTQEGFKTRDVFGYPIAATIKEQQFYRPYLDSVAKRQPWRAALIGPDAVAQGVTRVIRQAQALNHKIISIDFSSYDQSITPPIQEAVWKWISASFQRRYHSDLEWIENLFRTIPLVTPGGIVRGDHGVPSGSTFTNEVDSIAQFLVLQGVVDYEKQIQGDDGCYSASDPEDIFERCRSVGLTPNEDKSDISDYFAIYLQNYFSPGYVSGGIMRGVYPVSRALNRLVHLERWTDLESKGITGSDFFSIRAIAILENCKHHPLFKRLVQFVLDNDRDGLAFSGEGLQAYVANVDSRASRGIVQQHSDNLRGIRNFEAFKLAAAWRRRGRLF